MKVTLNREDLRMVVLKQIVANASLAMRIERKIGFFEYFIPFTPRKNRLKRLRKRGDRLQVFEKSLAVSKSEDVEINFNDVNFIYEGFVK